MFGRTGLTGDATFCPTPPATTSTTSQAACNAIALGREPTWHRGRINDVPAAWEAEQLALDRRLFTQRTVLGSRSRGGLHRVLPHRSLPVR